MMTPSFLLTFPVPSIFNLQEMVKLNFSLESAKHRSISNECA